MLKIIQDSREQIPWEFSFADVFVDTLKTGDYTLEGFENKIIIERKKSPSEIAQNLGSDFVRFRKELERMKSFSFAYIICEFSLEELLTFPKNIPFKNDIKINGKYLVKTLSTFKDLYGIEVIYAGSREKAIEKAEELFEIILELENG